MQKEPIKITVARGDGIGPEIMDATLNILNAAGASLDIEEIEVGEKVYAQGITTGIPDDAWDTLKRNRVFLKAPISTPQGGGYKSLNVTIRKTLGLFANVRPCRSMDPIVPCHYKKMDLVIVRENEEDLYAGIEHQQSQEVVQCIKLISRPGSEKIARYAFEYARANNRKKVTCMSKDNIMKLSDGLFHDCFKKVAKDYPEIEADHWIVDIGAAKVAAQPETLDVVVTTNLYGDIISDIAALVTGSVGLAGSSNIGEDFGMFEAIHGSAPDIAGMGIANPSGLLNGAMMMLHHIGQPEVAARIQNAWLKTLEDGIHTGDIYNKDLSKQRVNTQEFAQAVIERLGQSPEALKKANVGGAIDLSKISSSEPQAKSKKLIGIDVFIDWNEEQRNPEVLGKKLESLSIDNIEFHQISSRGVRVYPSVHKQNFYADHWICRFFLRDTSSTQSCKATILQLLEKINIEGIDYIKTENLYNFDGERGYSLAQGE